jgi:hypothetical protein
MRTARRSTANSRVALGKRCTRIVQAIVQIKVFLQRRSCTPFVSRCPGKKHKAAPGSGSAYTPTVKPLEKLLEIM